MTDVPVLAIDGPGGSGKGTIAFKIATARNWQILDSGALYRAFSFAADQNGVSPGDTRALQALFRTIVIQFKISSGSELRVQVNGTDVTEQIRSAEGGVLASKYASVPTVRNCLLSRQRQERKAPGLVADGRDMGTVVFPDATLKIYLTASIRVRAERRYKQLKGKGFDVNLARIEQEVSKRDDKDSSRAVSPMRPAEDSILVDTSDLRIAEVVKKIDSLLEDSLELIP